MNLLLSVIGPTATGKTDFSLQVANHLLRNKTLTGVDLISADSRQIYQGLETTSGADIPENFKKIYKSARLPFWRNSHDTLRLYGIASIQPNEEWSLAHFQSFAQKILKESWLEKRVPIIVGGTGLYHQYLLKPILAIKPNRKLRQKTDKMTVPELQNWLKKISPEIYSNMNHSDQNNPRRIARALEISLSPKKNSKEKNENLETTMQSQTFGLTDSLPNLEKKISLRVQKRFEQGSVPEIKNLLKKYQDLLPAVETAMGVQEISRYLNKEISSKECIQLWTLREFQYAKRQITWWKKHQPAHWLKTAQEKSDALKIIDDWGEDHKNSIDLLK